MRTTLVIDDYVMWDVKEKAHRTGQPLKKVVNEAIRLGLAQLERPTERHWDIFRRIISPLGSAGNLTTDAHLAALAIEHGATLCSTDVDFSRFQMLQWINPLVIKIIPGLP